MAISAKSTSCTIARYQIGCGGSVTLTPSTRLESVGPFSVCSEDTTVDARKVANTNMFVIGFCDLPQGNRTCERELTDVISKEGDVIFKVAALVPTAT